MLQPDYVFYILLHNAITLILSKAADNQQKEYILLTGSEEWNKNWKNLFYNIACSVDRVVHFEATFTLILSTTWTSSYSLANYTNHDEKLKLSSQILWWISWWRKGNATDLNQNWSKKYSVNHLNDDEISFVFLYLWYPMLIQINLTILWLRLSH